jgi:hypothetical protein
MTPGDAMPDIDDSTIARRGKHSRGRGRIEAGWSATIIVAMPLWLLACSPIEHPTPLATADISGSTIDEPPPGPIALAPAFTGTPTPAPAVAVAALPPALPVEAVALAAPPPAPIPAVAMAAPPPVLAAVVESAAAAPSPCPPGATVVMSKPDMAGIPVLLCRRSPPPR